MFDLLKTINEESPITLKLTPLKYDEKGLAPFISHDTIKAHYHVHTKGYFDKQHEDDFFKAGAILHEIYWKQFITTLSIPSTEVLDFIHDHFENVESFKQLFNDECMKVQGSGWVYLSCEGVIQTIVNHEVRDDIVLLQDCWEHAYYLDYGPNKKQFFDNFWKIIDWTVVKTNLEKLGCI